MANPWFRLYSEFSSDPKIQSMSEAMQRRLVMLFCLRCSNALETLQEQEIIYALGLTEEEWKETKELFVTKCFIRFIKGKCNITNWNKRQFISDSSTERVRKYRANKATFPKRSEPVAVTPPDSYSDTEHTHIQTREREEPKDDFTTRFERIKSIWNDSGLKPIMRKSTFDLMQDERTAIAGTMRNYSDDDIRVAIDNYAQILKSSDHCIENPYRGLTGFIRGGVEKFGPDADPWQAFKKKPPTWEKPERETLDDRPDATSPEQLARELEEAAQGAMSEEERAIALEQWTKEHPDSPMAKALARIAG